MKSGEWLTVGQAARLAGRHPDTGRRVFTARHLRRLIRSGDIATFRDWPRWAGPLVHLDHLHDLVVSLGGLPETGECADEFLAARRPNLDAADAEAAGGAR